ncbi:hypothetical protein AB0D49_32845 [Streptomyces sp. NPDC048290]|uniref:hypothetical protein n=1 Tax=Streptomyces sp. NPDC048290 TaxID=3155811 RepID=UPI003436A533
MPRVEELLSRALLVRERTVPRDVVPARSPSAAARRPSATAPAGRSACTGAAEDLRVLCEVLVTHTPADAVADFVTEQVPGPRSALVLACVLQLNSPGADAEGARFWWQYAAGAGQAAAAYCLYLHHLAQGERATADWWHRQTDDARRDPPPGPGPQPSDRDRNPGRRCPGHPADLRFGNAPIATFLRILSRLSRNTVRRRSPAVARLMAYIPQVVTAGYLRGPETELPLPGAGFDRRIKELLTAGAPRRDSPGARPAHATAAADPGPETPSTRPTADGTAQASPPRTGNTATGQTSGGPGRQRPPDLHPAASLREEQHRMATADTAPCAGRYRHHPGPGGQGAA